MFIVCVHIVCSLSDSQLSYLILFWISSEYGDINKIVTQQVVLSVLFIIECLLSSFPIPVFTILGAHS